jgi:hypothetical protein
MVSPDSARLTFANKINAISTKEKTVFILINCNLSHTFVI